MSDVTLKDGTEKESRRVAEESREQEWTGRAFIRELYLGQLPLDIVHPFPMTGGNSPEFDEWITKLETFLIELRRKALIWWRRPGTGRASPQASPKPRTAREPAIR